jgi:hypothetical protein
VLSTDLRRRFDELAGTGAMQADGSLTVPALATGALAETPRTGRLGSREDFKGSGGP